MQSRHFGSKIKIPKNMSKSILKIIYTCSVKKTAAKNNKYSRKETILQIGHHAKAKPTQNPQFRSKIRIPKYHVKIHSANHLQLFCAKNHSKKH